MNAKTNDAKETLYNQAKTNVFNRLKIQRINYDAIDPKEMQEMILQEKIFLEAKVKRDEKHRQEQIELNRNCPKHEEILEHGNTLFRVKLVIAMIICTTIVYMRSHG